MLWVKLSLQEGDAKLSYSSIWSEQGLNKMATKTVTPGSISPEFAARLRNLPPREKVQVILILDVGDLGNDGKRQTPIERKEAIMRMRESSEPAVRKIDEILKRYGGRRLTDEVSSLGWLAVDTTTEGILALADSNYVKAVLEDQAIHPLPHRAS